MVQPLGLSQASPLDLCWPLCWPLWSFLLILWFYCSHAVFLETFYIGRLVGRFYYPRGRMCVHEPSPTGSIGLGGIGENYYYHIEDSSLSQGRNPMRCLSFRLGTVPPLALLCPHMEKWDGGLPLFPLGTPKLNFLSGLSVKDGKSGWSQASFWGPEQSDLCSGVPLLLQHEWTSVFTAFKRGLLLRHSHSHNQWGSPN